MSDDDSNVLHRITALVDEQHRLREAAAPADAARLRHVQERLDPCRNPLRQRRARREFGGDPAGAQMRSAGTVGRCEG